MKKSKYIIYPLTKDALTQLPVEVTLLNKVLKIGSTDSNEDYIQTRLVALRIQFGS